MITYMDWLQTQIADNSLQDWLIAATITVTVLVLLLGFRYIARRQLKSLAEHNELQLWPVIHAAMKRTTWLFLLILAVVIGANVLEISDTTGKIIHITLIIALLIQFGLWASAALRSAIEQYRKQQLGKDPASVTTLNLLNFIARVAVWLIVLLLVLDNLGVNITALVAGLGVGGIAVALAMQTILGDLFASLAIVLDKPFVVGDFLIIGDLMGSVEYVGLKTTRLRSLSGEQLVFSNSDLLSSRIRNYGRMYERRVQFDIGVTYQTPRDKLLRIPPIIKAAVTQHTDTRFDRSHFKQYGDFALVFESVYFVLGPDYNRYMDIQQAINLHIHEQFEKAGIEFAYPTQTLLVKQT